MLQYFAKRDLAIYNGLTLAASSMMAVVMCLPPTGECPALCSDVAVPCRQWPCSASCSHRRRHWWGRTSPRTFNGWASRRGSTLSRQVESVRAAQGSADVRLPACAAACWAGSCYACLPDCQPERAHLRGQVHHLSGSPTTQPPSSSARLPG